MALLTRLERMFANLKICPFERVKEKAPEQKCTIKANSEGGYSIYIGADIRIGNYGTSTDARRVAENWNFFIVED